jgi:hypothetical protein
VRAATALLSENLVRILRLRPRQGTAELATALGVSSQSVRRLLGDLPEGSVLAAGRTRRARYALRRPLRGTLTDIPVYQVDRSGSAAPLATLALAAPQGSLMSLAEAGWPVPAVSRDGWWDGLPYPVLAIRPQGYLGRQFARAEHRALGVAPDPEEWSDDDVVWVLSQRGADAPGNLIVGDSAYERWLEAKVRPPAPLHEREIPVAYAARAEDAVALAGGGSSAAGEFPKFTAAREQAGATTPHVLVKFSGAAGSAAERRWADLLACEHLALASSARLPGPGPARSRLLEHAGRTFIEVERFDRIGEHGRLPVCDLESLQGAFVGSRTTAWPDIAGRLQGMKLIEPDAAAAVDHLWWYGRLIANTDMHLGNLSFRVGEPLRLAPTYDMLPMMYAPLPGGEVPARDFAPALPLPAQRATWLAACAAAIEFWSAAAADTRISEPFRDTCRRNAESLDDIAGKV